MSAPKNFWIFVIAGVIELIVGLGTSIYISMTQSWTLGIVLALGFFMSANMMFMIAYKKIR